MTSALAEIGAAEWRVRPASCPQGELRLQRKRRSCSSNQVDVAGITAAARSILGSMCGRRGCSGDELWLCTVAFSLLIALTAAISLSRFRFRGRSTVLTSLLIAQLFPAVLLVIPLQVELRTMSLLDSRWGLMLVYTTFATPFATFLLKSFLDGLPRELDEAATIDGCSPLQLIRHILLPLMRPGLTAAGTYIFIFAWNEFLYALTFTQTTAAQTIPVGLSMFIGEYQIRWDLLTAGGVLAAVPVLVGFMLVQKQLVSGLTAGAVKG